MRVVEDDLVCSEKQIKRFNAVFTEKKRRARRNLESRLPQRCAIPSGKLRPQRKPLRALAGVSLGA